MKKFGLACAAAAFALSGAAAAQGDLKGFGTAQCGDLVNIWDGATYEERGQILLAVGQWTFGYLSGRNAELRLADRKELAALDSDGTALFILTQCRDFPDVFVYQIADIIYEAAPFVSPGV